MGNFEVVKNARLMKMMEKRGIIKFHSHTLSNITGLYSDKKFKCFYIESAPFLFKFKERIYGQRFFDGCFQPYLVEYSNIKDAEKIEDLFYAKN